MLRFLIILLTKNIAVFIISMINCILKGEMKLAEKQLKKLVKAEIITDNILKNELLEIEIETITLEGNLYDFENISIDFEYTSPSGKILKHPDLFTEKPLLRKMAGILLMKKANRFGEYAFHQKRLENIFPR